jgi:hypothetical protein
MKNNRKTLKRKSLLKKRKGGKTARKKGGRDFGVMKSLGFQPIFSSSGSDDKPLQCDENQSCGLGCQFCREGSICSVDSRYKHPQLKNVVLDSVNASVIVQSTDSNDIVNKCTNGEFNTVEKLKAKYGLTTVYYCPKCWQIIMPKRVPIGVKGF